MKKRLSYINKPFLIFALIFAVSGIAFPQETSAQIPGSPSNEAECVQRWREDNPNQSVPESVTASCRIQFSNVGQISTEAERCGITNIGCQIMERVVPGVAEILLKFASLLTGFAAIILNGVVYLTVVKISENYSNIPAIDIAWKTIRDLANMGFIFILLYAAIQTIIGIGKDTQKLIVKVIVIAVLINFSLFFTKLIIDASNILAITFYDAIAPEALSAAGGFNWTQKGLSDAFMQHLSLQSLYKVAKISTGAVITTGIMGSIMLLVAAFVFFAVAILFIIRYVVLILVLILSPIAFLSFVLPQLEKYRNQWWDALSGQAFFAPIYFALTWVTLSVLGGIMSSFGKISDTTAGGATALGNLAITGSGAVDSGGGGAFAMLINFIVIIVFLIVSLIIAKEWANKAPGGVSKLTSWAMGAAGGASFGLAGRFGRGTIGRAGEALAQNEWLKDKAPTSMAARLALATGRKTSGASFDVRGVGALSVLDAGKAQKGGFAEDMKKKTEAEKKYADTFKPSDLVIAEAEKEFEDAKKNGTASQIAEAQNKVDKLKGLSEDEARKREAQNLINELALRGEYITDKEALKRIKRQEGRRLGEITRLTLTNPNMTRKQAEEEVDRRIASGELQNALKLETIKGAANERKEAYAKDRESGKTTIGIGKASVTIPHFDITGRIAAVGPIKRERRAIANEIRKSTKEKKSSEKIVEEITRQAEEAAEGAAEPAAPAEGAGPTTPPAGGPTS